VGKKIGVTQSLISMVLSGDRPPNNKIIKSGKTDHLSAPARRPRRAGTCHVAAGRLAADWVALGPQVERIDGEKRLTNDNENNRSVR
jgi:hypothetical protein